MNDERAVEAMRTILNRMDDPAWTVPQVQTFLAALRAEGFDLYRPDECKPVYRLSILAGTYGQCDIEDAEYRLVPVGGEG